MAKALLISPYHAESHKIWAESVISMCPEFDWQLASLPPRFFDWRIRGNALALLYEPEYASLFTELELIVATSMTDLATLKGLCGNIRHVPSAIYFHENQFAYPSNNVNPRDRMLEAKLVTLYGGLAADLVLFNSRFNLETFLEGARSMLRDFPDHAPLGCVDAIERKSKVLPVPVPLPSDLIASLSDQANPTACSGPLKIAWNHRWEYDKAPDRLAAVIALVAERGINCEFSIFGQRFRQIPDEFIDLRDRYGSVIRHIGYVEDRRTYYEMLREHHVVFSTALHDFQGLSVLEAVRLGCLPLVPDRLAYQEYLPQCCRYPSHEMDKDAEANAAACRLQSLSTKLSDGKLPKPPVLDDLGCKALAPQYRSEFYSLLAGGKGA